MIKLITKNTGISLGILGVVFLSAVMLGAWGGVPFLSMEGLLIVIGGSIANALLSYPRKEVRKACIAISNLFKAQRDRHNDLYKDVMRIIMWAYVTQTHNFIGLEKEGIKTARDPLERYGLDLVVSGYPADKIREMMRTAARTEFERQSSPVAVLRNMAAMAPAFGVAGTLIVVMTLMYNGGDLTMIHGGLTVAMLSTLYGILLARLVCLPAADQLQRQLEAERFRKRMLTEGLVLLSEKQKPHYVQDRLNSFLEPAQHLQLDRYVRLAFNNRLATVA